jgi:hypothetical protein
MLQIITTEKELTEILNKVFLSAKPPQITHNVNEYLTTPKAAELLGRSINAIRVMVCKNQIKHIKKGGKLYFSKLDLIEYLESGRVEIERVNAVDVLKQKKS